VFVLIFSPYFTENLNFRNIRYLVKATLWRRERRFRNSPQTSLDFPRREFTSGVNWWRERLSTPADITCMFYRQLSQHVSTTLTNLNSRGS
jgi:hypothetical protein